MTSRLDEIFDKLTDDVIAHPVGGGPAASHNKAKHQLLDLFEQLGLEVIGKDIDHRRYCDLKNAQYIPEEAVTCTCDAVGINRTKQRQRTRLEKLIKELGQA